MDEIIQLNKWSLWYHHEKDNRKISGYKKIYEINNSTDFWKLYNNWETSLGSFDFAILLYFFSFFVDPNRLKPFVDHYTFVYFNSINNKKVINHN